MYLTQGFHRSLRQTPDEVATIYGDRVRTFREQGDRVARLAGALRDLGVASDDRVGILSLNSDRYAEYLLAVPWADAVLNPVNIRWSPAEIAYSINDSDTKVLLIDDAFAPMAPALKAQCAGLTTMIHCGDGPTPDGMLAYEEILAAAEPVEDVRRSGDALAGLFYTGGTTGFPKGVMLSHANLTTSSLGMLASSSLLQNDAVLLHAAPMFHLADLAAWLGQVMTGGRHVIVPFFDPKAVCDAIATHKVTDVLLVPTMIQLVVDNPDVGSFDLSSLQHILYGASSIAEGLLKRTMALLPHVRLAQAYGMTELAPVATLLLPDDHREPYLRAAGRPAAHVELEIRDADGKPVPTGTVGEVCVRGGNVMLGYWNRPQETAAAVRDGWMHTGDGGYLDADGYLYIVDRIKDMIISGGENVYSAEVESALSQHPAVLQSAVIGLPDPEWGERVHAVIVAAPGTEPDPDEIREFVKERIAGYKTPRSFDFVTELPVSGAGKILKRELREQYAAATD